MCRRRRWLSGRTRSCRGTWKSKGQGVDTPRSPKNLLVVDEFFVALPVEGSVGGDAVSDFLEGDAVFFLPVGDGGDGVFQVAGGHDFGELVEVFGDEFFVAVGDLNQLFAAVESGEILGEVFDFVLFIGSECGEGAVVGVEARNAFEGASDVEFEVVVRRDT